MPWWKGRSDTALWFDERREQRDPARPQRRLPVVATASPHNFDYLRSLGAAEVVDRRSRTAVDEIVDLIGAGPLAGTLAIGSGSLVPAAAIASRTTGGKRVA
ncbi:UNVERIFIED_ORG: hypothetical protein FHR35_001266 [Microbispora rosea subsp. rosea]